MNQTNKKRNKMYIYHNSSTMINFSIMINYSILMNNNYNIMINRVLQRLFKEKRFKIKNKIIFQKKEVK